MRVLHIPYCFYPDPVGGTEIYVASLAQALTVGGVDCTIVAPAEHSATYRQGDLRVRRFALSPQVTDLRELYGEGDIQAANEFACVLDEEKPGIVHLHAFTRGVSLRLVRAAHARNIPVVFTYHTPTVSCQRGTLLRWGGQVCDGVLDLTRCTACNLHAHGLYRPLAEVVARTPAVAGGLLAKGHRAGGVWTALRMRELMQLRHTTFRALMQEVDQVIALNEWTRKLLMRNGARAEKITVIRHGLPTTPPVYTSNTTSSRNDHGLRIAALGRLDPTKGFDILIRAIRGIPDAKLSLDLYGIAQDAKAGSYLQTLKLLACDDNRITFCKPVPSGQVITLLRTYDLVAVPSRILETGPLVVLEAFAAGIPVIGSNLGGIAELVQHGANGLLVEVDSVTAWSGTLENVAQDAMLLARLRQAIHSPPSISLAAESTLQLYRAVKAGSTTSTDAIP